MAKIRGYTRKYHPKAGETFTNWQVNNLLSNGNRVDRNEFRKRTRIKNIFNSIKK